MVMASVVMENNAVIVAGPSWKMKHRGYAYAQKRAIYENFQGKSRSVLLLCNSLFNGKIIKKRKDLTVVILGQK
jgi:hypothetical protein